MGRRPRPLGMHLARPQSARLAPMRARPAYFAPRSSASTPRHGVAKPSTTRACCRSMRPQACDPATSSHGGALWARWWRADAPTSTLGRRASGCARSVCAPAFCAPCPVIDRRDGAGPRGVQRCCCERGSRLCTLKLWIARAAIPPLGRWWLAVGAGRGPTPRRLRGRVPASGEVLHGRGCVSWARSHRLRFFQRPFQASNPPGQKTQE